MARRKRAGQWRQGQGEDSSIDTYVNLKDLLEKQGHATPYKFALALYEYSDCGVWTYFFLLTEGQVSRVYYKDMQARQTDWLDRCTGINIGGIVKGSEVEVGPTTLTFPFTSQALKDAVAAIDHEADAYRLRQSATLRPETLSGKQT